MCRPECREWSRWFGSFTAIFPLLLQIGGCVATFLPRETVIPVDFEIRLAQSLPRVAGQCPAEIWHVELPEGRTVPRAVKPP